MGVAPTVTMGPLAPSLILLVTYQTTSVPILMLLSKSAQFGQKWQLIRSKSTISGTEKVYFETVAYNAFYYLCKTAIQNPTVDKIVQLTVCTKSLKCNQDI